MWELILEFDVVNTIQLIMRKLLFASSRYADGISYGGLDQSVSYLGIDAISLLVRRYTPRLPSEGGERCMDSSPGRHMHLYELWTLHET